MFSSHHLVIYSILFSAITCLRWTPTPQDGQILSACAGQDTTIPWTFELSRGEDIVSIQWYFRGSSQEMIAMFSGSTFLALPAFSGRVQQVTNGGVSIRHVTLGDAGNYSVVVNGKDGSSGTLITLKRMVLLQVFDGLPTSDGQLHVAQQPEAILDNTTQQWSVVLSCGHFIFLSQPAFPVEWVNPSGNVSASSVYHEGYFDLHLNNPVAEGSYTCRVPQRSLTTACVHGNQNSAIQASVLVDRMDARTTVMETELRALRQDKRLLDILVQENRELSERVTILENTRGNGNASLCCSVQEMAATPGISFSAQAQQHQQLSPPALVNFDILLNNQGNAFDTASGKFTAPTPGTYFFLFHTQSYNTSHAHSRMVADGRELCRAFIYVQYGQGSCLAVIHLAAGQKAWVEPYASEESFAAYATSFSGFLINGDPE